MTPDAAVSCLEVQWCKRKRIAIQPGRVDGGPHASFPLLVSFASDADLAADARDDGKDLVFTDGDGIARLAYERQRFDGNSGALLAWVNVPALASTTVIYLYYGNAAAADQQQVTATWNAAYKGVWHLDVAPVGSTPDATSNANHGLVAIGTTVDNTGKVGGGATFNAATDRITVANSASLDATSSSGTFETWVNLPDPSVANRYQSIMSTTETYALPSSGFSWATQPDGDYYFYPWVRDNNFALTTNPFANDTWHLAAVTFDYAMKSVKLFVDGESRLLAENMTPTAWTQATTVTNWMWGSNPSSPADALIGKLDELRVSAGVRDPSWLRTTYRNQSAPTTFYSLGAAEALE